MTVIKKTFPIKNMACAMCVAHVQKALAAVPGVKDVNVNLASNSALVEYDDAAVTPEKMKEAVVGAGYDMVIDAAGAAPEALDESQKKNSKSFLGKLFGR